MPDILHDFPVFAPIENVFQAISTPDGINTWWTLTCPGEPIEESIYELGFGDGHQWKARLVRVRPDAETERVNLTVDMIPNDWVRSMIAEAAAK